MNRVLCCAEDIPLPSWAKAAAAYSKKVLGKLGLDNWELSVLFCNNKYIKSLNAQYRNKDEPTDVLSFPMDLSIGRPRMPVAGRPRMPVAGRYIAGDIVISLDAVEENARFFKVSGDKELRRLLVHGILHLAGFDHATNEEEEPMLKTQEEILTSLDGEMVMEKIK
jgi:probable rRNA maturation factor